MTPSTIIRECSRRGVSLATEGDSLRLQGQVSALGTALRSLLLTHKFEIIAHLKEQPDPPDVELVHLLAKSSPPSPPPSPPFFEGGLSNQSTEVANSLCTYNNNNFQKLPNSPPSPPLSRESTRHEGEIKTETLPLKVESRVLYSTPIYPYSLPKGGLGGLGGTQDDSLQRLIDSPPAEKGALKGGLFEKGGLGASDYWHLIAEAWPDLVRDEWQERAAIMHFDGGLPIRLAEHRAFVEVVATPIGLALVRAGDDPEAIDAALELYGYTDGPVTINVELPPWREEVASWPNSRWSAWRSRSGEMIGPDATVAEIRAAEFAAYSEMTEVGEPGQKYIDNIVIDVAMPEPAGFDLDEQTNGDIVTISSTPAATPDPDAELLEAIRSAGFRPIDPASSQLPAWVHDRTLSVSLANLNESVALHRAMSPTNAT